MARDFLVRFSSDALLVIIGAAGRKDEVGVRVDETGKHHAPAKIELFRPASLVQRFDPAARADGRDAVSLHENRTIARNEPLEGKNLRTAGDEQSGHADYQESNAGPRNIQIFYGGLGASLRPWAGRRRRVRNTLARHRDFDAGFIGKGDGFGVASVRMASDADAGIVGEHALDARVHFPGAVGDQHLPGVLGIADADPAAVVDGNPARAAGGIEQGIQEGPIGDGIGPVAHGFRLAIGRRNGTAIEMVAADYDGSLQFAAGDQTVERETEFIALAVAEPADARGQALIADTFPRKPDPACQNFVFGKHFQDELIGAMNVGRLSGKRGPTKWPAAFAEEGPDVCGHEAGKIVSVFYALLESERADVVTVVEGDRSQLLQCEHSFNVNGNGFEGAPPVGFRIGFAQIRGLLDGEVLWDVTADRIVRTGLIGEQIGHDAAAGEGGNDVRAVGDQADGSGFAPANGVFQNAERFVEIVDHNVAVAGFHAALDALRINVDTEEGGTIQGGREGLRATHPPHPAADDQLSG